VSGALPARGAGEVLGVSPDGEAKQRLEKLISTLRAFRGELLDAEREGLEFVAARAREEIRRLHALIRRHCEWHGLARPHDVPEND